MRRSFWIGQTLALSLAGLAFIPGMSVTLAAQSPLYEGLRTTAGIIFGVLGAWIAIVYPNALQRVLNFDSRASDAELKKLMPLIHGMFYSTLILTAVLLFGPASQAVKQWPAAIPYHEFLRGASFSTLVYLTLAQLWVMAIALLPADMLTEEIGLRARKKGAVESLQSRITVNKGPR